MKDRFVDYLSVAIVWMVVILCGMLLFAELSCKSLDVKEKGQDIEEIDIKYYKNSNN